MARLIRSLAARDGREPRLALRALLPDEPESDALVSGVVELAGLAPPSATAPDGAWSVRRMLQSVAERKPLVVLVDDLQWADDTMLDLVATVVRPGQHLPLVVLTTARPELCVRRPFWPQTAASAVLRLGAMVEQEADELLARLLGGSPLGSVARQHLTAAAHGNPLFLEETLGMLVDDGVLTREGGRWTANGDLTEVPLPASVAALVAARLDLLAAPDREVLEHAAVLGDRTPQETLTALLPTGRRPELTAALVRLDQADLLHLGPGTSNEPRSGGVTFHHQVVRDVVYASLTKRRRITLHTTAAAVVQAGVGVGEETQAQSAYHLEQAVLLAAELGPLLPEDAQRARAAAGALGRLGRQVSARGDVPATVNLLQRARRVLPTADVDRPRLLAELGSTLVDAGRYDDAGTVLSEALSCAQERGDEAAVATADLAGLWLDTARAPSGWAKAAQPRARAALSVFLRDGDDAGSGRAWAVLAEVAFLQCRIDASERAVRRSSTFARRGGNVREEAQNAGVLALTALVGPTPAPGAIRRCRRLLSTYRDNPFVGARVQMALGVLLAMTGDGAAARGTLGGGIEQLQALGQPVHAALCREALGEAEVLSGDAAAAQAALRRSLAELDAVGESLQSGAVAGRLATTLDASQADEAGQLIRRARAAAPEQDTYAQVRWRLSDARVALVRGSSETSPVGRRTLQLAARRAEQALALLEASDALGLTAEAHLLLARAHAEQGRTEAGREAATEALVLFCRKGHAAGAEAAIAAGAVTLPGSAPPDGARR